MLLLIIELENQKHLFFLKEKQPYNDMKHTSGIALPKSVTF